MEDAICDGDASTPFLETPTFTAADRSACAIPMIASLAAAGLGSSLAPRNCWAAER